MSALSRPEFHNEEAAFAHVEAMIWGSQPTCPHCGGVERITKVRASREKRIRVGLWRCGRRKCQFNIILLRPGTAAKSNVSKLYTAGTVPPGYVPPLLSHGSSGTVMRLYINAACCPPRLDPANSHALPPSAMPRSARSAAALFVRQTARLNARGQAAWRRATAPMPLYQRILIRSPLHLQSQPCMPRRIWVRPRIRTTAPPTSKTTPPSMRREKTPVAWIGNGAKPGSANIPDAASRSRSRRQR